MRGGNARLGIRPLPVLPHFSSGGGGGHDDGEGEVVGGGEGR